MFERFTKASKKRENYPESLLAANWWADRLSDDKVRIYRGNICLVRDKKSVPEVKKVALFADGIREIVDSYLDRSEGIFDLKLSSSDRKLLELADEVDIDDFESHFGEGAVMFISPYDGVTVSYKGEKRSRKL